MLDQDQVQKIRMMFSTAGWNEVVKPAIENRIRQRIRLLILHPSERAKEYRDDVKLRCDLEALEWLLMGFQNELIAAENNRRVDELDRASQMNGGQELATGPPANP